MGYENDFVDETPVKVEVVGRVFLYKPTTGRDENEWLQDIMEYDPDTKTTKMSIANFNKKMLCNITSVPYTKEQINKVIGVDKEWCDLTEDEKYKLISQLRPGLFDKLIQAIKKVDEINEKAIKN